MLSETQARLVIKVLRDAAPAQSHEGRHACFEAARHLQPHICVRCGGFFPPYGSKGHGPGFCLDRRTDVEKLRDAARVIADFNRPRERPMPSPTVIPKMCVCGHSLGYHANITVGERTGLLECCAGGCECPEFQVKVKLRGRPVRDNPQA